MRRNAVTSLIGPSGCGKTTLLRCFNRINERYDNVRTEGEILIQGSNIFAPDVDLIELRKTRRHGVPTTESAADLDPRQRALRLPPAHAARRALEAAPRTRRSRAALRAVQLWDTVKDRLGPTRTSLQLEQQQKLCIARLLPLKPDVILMDEPCSALDPDATGADRELDLRPRPRATRS